MNHHVPHRFVSHSRCIVLIQVQPCFTHVRKQTFLQDEWLNDFPMMFDLIKMIINLYKGIYENSTIYAH